LKERKKYIEVFCLPLYVVQREEATTTNPATFFSSSLL